MYSFLTWPLTSPAAALLYYFVLVSSSSIYSSFVLSSFRSSSKCPTWLDPNICLPQVTLSSVGRSSLPESYLLPPLSLFRFIYHFTFVFLLFLLPFITSRPQLLRPAYLPPPPPLNSSLGRGFSLVIFFFSLLLFLSRAGPRKRWVQRCYQRLSSPPRDSWDMLPARTSKSGPSDLDTPS